MIGNTINVSVNGYLKKMNKDPLSKEELTLISNYTNNLIKSELLNIVDIGHFYDNKKYNKNLTLSDTYNNKHIKLVFNENIHDLLIKYKILEFIIYKEF